MTIPLPPDDPRHHLVNARPETSRPPDSLAAIRRGLVEALREPTDEDAALWAVSPWRDGREWTAPPPRELPALRAEIIDNLRTGFMHHYMHKLVRDKGSALSRVFPKAPPELVADAMLEEEVQRLEHATLFYFTADMVAEVLDSAASLPDDWGIMPDDLPHASEAGLILYETPFYEYTSRPGTHGEPGERVLMVGASWGPTMVRAEHGCVWATFWSATDYQAMVANMRWHDDGGDVRAKLTRQGVSTDLVDVVVKRHGPRRNYAVEARELRPPIGWDNETIMSWGADGMNAEGLKRAMIGLGADPAAPVPQFGDPAAGTLDYNRILTASWLMIQQQDWVDVTEQRPSKREARRLQREGHSTAAVNVVSLKRTMRRADDDPAAGHPERGKLVKRQRVRAHWRNQAYGPGHTLRKRKLVKRHERGPLGNGYYDTVHVVKP